MTTATADRIEEDEADWVDPHEYRIHVKYLTEEDGTRVGVVISPEDWELLLDELGELWDTRAYDRAKAEGGETIPWEELEARLDEMNRSDDEQLERAHHGAAKPRRHPNGDA